jgi:hypothetical protein
VPATPAAEAGAPLSLGRHDPTLRGQGMSGSDGGLSGPAQRRGVHEAQVSGGADAGVNNLGCRARSVLATLYRLVAGPLVVTVPWGRVEGNRSRTKDTHLVMARGARVKVLIRFAAAAMQSLEPQ